MTKFPPIPRLTIVVPVGRDLAAFEASLISVLENQPNGCEVIVAHDGSYDDPFDLGDEVRFVVCESNQFVQLISVAADQARGRFVHILADGVLAQNGWVDAAIEKFEHHDAAAIVPVIRTENNEILAAGWHDGASRLCQAAASGQTQIARRLAARIVGPYLHASFWRREVLRSMPAAFQSDDPIEASYCYSHLLRAVGWRSVLATECNMGYEGDTLSWDAPSFQRGRQLRAIRSVFRDRGWLAAWTASAKALIANMLRPQMYAESLGQAAAPLVVDQMHAKTHLEEVFEVDERQVIQMPARTGDSQSRRAA